MDKLVNNKNLLIFMHNLDIASFMSYFFKKNLPKKISKKYFFTKYIFYIKFFTDLE